MGRKDAIALVALAFLFLVLFAPGLLGHLLVVRDMPGVTIPSHAAFRNAVLAGELPVWNPLVGIGIPTLAVPVHGALYPGNLLLLVGSLATGMAVTWAVHMWIAAAGGYALARAAEARPETAFLAAILFGLSGYAVSIVGTGEKTLPYAWVPWMAWTISRVVAERSASRVFLAALPPVLMCAAGDPFLLFDGVIFAFPFAVAAVRSSRTRSAAVSDVALAFALPLLLAGLLAAPVLLPAALLRGETLRAAALAKANAEWWSLSPSRWLELFLSRPFGDPPISWVDTRPGHEDDTQAVINAWAVSLYVGVGTLGLSAAARGRLAKLLVVASVIGVLVALGRYLPVYAAIVQLLPPLGLARYPEKHVAVASDALAILAALGAERLLRREASVFPPLLISALGLALAIGFGPWWLGFPVQHGIAQSVITLTLLVTAFALAFRTPRLMLLPALVVTGDLFAAAFPLFAWLPSSGVPHSRLADDIVASEKNVPPRILRFSPEEPRSIANFPVNASVLYGIDAADGEDSAITPRLWGMVGFLVVQRRALDELLRLSALIVPTWEPESDDRPQWILRRSATAEGSHVSDENRLVSPKTAELPAAESALRPGKKDASQPRWVVRKVRARPRAFLVGRVELADGDAESDRVLEPGFDIEQEAVVSISKLSPSMLRDLEPLFTAPRAALGACDVEAYARNHVDLSCDAPQDALLVFADGFSDGWNAEVDGVPSDLGRADAVYRGVKLRPGRHRVRFAYDPPGLFEGGLLALLGALASALAIVRERAKRGAVGVTSALAAVR